MHRIVSGNKIFKLYYFLQKATGFPYIGVVSFGGAHSNHLVALAYACKQAGLLSAGVVRGEKPALLSHTLNDCISYGMKLKFIPREDYNKKEDSNFLASLQREFIHHLIVPEGGYSPLGARGAALISNYIDKDVTHICCPLGTATTVSGLLLSAKKNQQVIGVPVLKGLNDIKQRVAFLTDGSIPFTQLHLFDDYHFGGYAKKTPDLLKFMNTFFQQYSIETDFVYTAKMMYAVMDKIAAGYFAKGSKIACIHTGGLQGNLSLPEGSLIFK